jgi:DNA excision repair protein ERCC-3
MIVQGDGTILLEVENEFYSECRDWLSRFAELVKSPEYIHTYKITPLATWNAAASGLKSEKVLEILQRFSKYQLPQNILADIQDWFFRYGKLKLEKIADKEAASASYTFDQQHNSQINLLLLTSSDDLLITQIYNNKTVKKYILRSLSSNTLLIDAIYRGRIKNALIKIGYPVEDLVGFVPGDPLPIRLRERITSSNAAFSLRDYQNHASEAFYASGSERGGSGVIVMPCGAGKTIVGIDIISKVCQETLIVGSSTVGVRQWISELLEKSHIDRNMIGEYT